MSVITLFATLSQPSNVKYSGYQTLNNEGHPSHVITSFQHKHSYYYNGKTYFLWMKTNALDNKNMVFSFDHSTKEISASYDTLTTIPSANDLHSHGSLFISTSGTLIVATCSRSSGDSGIYISRASINDITTWTPIAQSNIDTADCQYCQISQISSGRIFLWYRKTRNQAKIMYSDDDGLTWSTPIVFFDFNNGNLEWMYPSSPPNNNNGDKIHIVITRRNYLSYPGATVYFPEVYYMTTNDGINFSNVEENWSKDVVTNGYITKAEIESNALVNQAVSQESIIWNIGGTIGSDGTIYLLNRKEGGGTNLVFWSGSAWVVREVTTNNPIENQHSRQGIIHLGGDNLIVYLLETIAGKDQLVSYITNNKGLTWSYEKQYTDSQFTHEGRADVTDNIENSGKGLLATIKGDGLGVNSEIFIQEI